MLCGHVTSALRFPGPVHLSWAGRGTQVSAFALALLLAAETWMGCVPGTDTARDAHRRAESQPAKATSRADERVSRGDELVQRARQNPSANGVRYLLELAGDDSTAVRQIRARLDSLEARDAELVRKRPPARVIAESARMVDVSAIAGKTASEVDRVLGQPSSTETTRNAGRTLPVRLYRADQVKVVFVAGKADWISVYQLDSHPFDSGVLDALGVPNSTPTWSGPAVLRWDGIAGLREISAFPNGSGGTSYAYICVATTP